MRITLIALHFTEYIIELANALSMEHNVMLIIDKEEKRRIIEKEDCHLV